MRLPIYDIDYPRNPHSEAALKPGDTHPGYRFITYAIGQPDSKREGHFTSLPYRNGDDDLVVDIKWADGHIKQDTLLSDLGICVSRYTGEFNDHVTILYGEDGP